MNNYFKRAGDLDDKQSEENIIGAGSMIISLKELEKMKEDDCYKITKEIYLNSEMIIVEYKQYQKENSRHL